MYCMNGTLYLEETLANVTIAHLNHDPFCKASFAFIKLVSLPLGSLIIMINILAYIAIDNLVKTQRFGGNAVTIKAIACIDVLNGTFALLYFYESAQGEFMKGYDDASGKLVWKTVIWVSWVCIYSSCMLRLYLCCQRIYSYIQLLITGENTHLIPGSKRKSTIICVALIVVANIELLVVLLTKIYHESFVRAIGLTTIPFFGIQAGFVVIVSVASVFVLVFSRLRTYRNSTVRSAVTSLVLICCSSVFTNFATFYGDFLCFGIHPGVMRDITKNTFLHTLKPECFIPLAKTLTYFDSLFFPLILLSGNYMKKSLEKKCLPVPGI